MYLKINIKIDNSLKVYVDYTITSTTVNYVDITFDFSFSVQ